MKEYAGIHEEFVKVIQGASSLYRFGSDRINNAEDYCRKHAIAMTSFSSKELHPDTCQHYRKLALERIPLNQRTRDVEGDGNLSCLDGQN